MSLHKDDLISKLGTKTTSAEGGDQSTKTATGEGSPKQSSTVDAATKTVSEDGKSSSAEAGKTTVMEPESWSKDSALKEVTKLREENKLQRLKYAEQLDLMRKELEEKAAPLKSQIDELKVFKDELDKTKAAEQDKKRSLEDKVAYREARIAELEAKFNAVTQDREKEAQVLKDRLSAFEAESQARRQVYEQKLKQELESVPEKFREHAELIAKGAGEPSQALVALAEARIKGLFEDRTVVVNHSVPGAKDGARSNKEQLDAAARGERDKMSSQQKIATALKDIRTGNGNDAFRTR